VYAEYAGGEYVVATASIAEAKITGVSKVDIANF
jgi:hypothetical protein